MRRSAVLNVGKIKEDEKPLAAHKEGTGDLDDVWPSDPAEVVASPFLQEQS